MIVAVHSKWALWVPRLRRNPKQKKYVENKLLAPLRMLQDSGVVWGLGSDGQVVAYDSPFFTLQWAVTGQDVTGRMFLDGKLTREEALIAHTRNNAYIINKDKTLGTLEVGKFADLLVLDRDYMTVPELEIRKIRPLLTMVDGKVVYDAR